MNKDLKRLIANILKERRNHNPIPLRVSNTIHLLIEEKTISDIIDLRDLSNARKEKKIDTPKYIQVFESKHGYINNLSILDLIFSEGPNSVSLITN